MTDAGFFRGTSSEQDNRFSDKEKKLLKQMKFAESITKKVDMSRVNLNIMKPWISTRISELLGMEDDVLNEFVYNQLEANNNPDGRRIQINLTGFLNGKNARIFTGELWDLLLDAMENSGVPSVILNAKKAEISQRVQQDQNNKDDDKNNKSSRVSDLKSIAPHDDRKTHSSSRDNRYPQDRDRDNRTKHGSHQSQHKSSQDEIKSRKRELDYSPDRNRDRNRDRERDRDGDRDRERDDRRARDDNSRKRSRFSDLQPESEVVKSVEHMEINKEKSPEEPPKLPKPKLDEGEDFEKVEMKRRSKKSKHHRKRRKSSSSSRDEDSDDRPKKSRSRERKKKKKKSSSKRRDKSKERSNDESTTMEQELRVRALESMKKQKRMH